MAVADQHGGEWKTVECLQLGVDVVIIGAVYLLLIKSVIVGPILGPIVKSGGTRFEFHQNCTCIH